MRGMEGDRNGPMSQFGDSFFAEFFFSEKHPGIYPSFSGNLGSRKMGTVGTCSQPICDFGSHFWLAS